VACLDAATEGINEAGAAVPDVVKDRLHDYQINAIQPMSMDEVTKSSHHELRHCWIQPVPCSSNICYLPQLVC
jgi:hypothetical protein